MFNTIAIAGATGAVGTEMCRLINERYISADHIRLLASARSAGKVLNVGGRNIKVEELTHESFDGVDLALFSAGGSRSTEFAPSAVKSNAIVIDNSSAYRMDPDVPLVVPEVNPEDALEHKGIIANPNCSTIIMAVAIAPLHRANPIRRIVVSTYQSASGAGAQAMAELENQSRDILAGKPANPTVFPHPIAFNLFCHNSPLDETGYNTEEKKMMLETRKILHAPDLAISATCVRVPVLRAHSEAVNLTFQSRITPQQVRDILEVAPGIRLVDDRKNARFPMPIEASGQDDVLVGHIRQDLSQPDGNGIDLFISGDQILKGAALNAVQIAQLLSAKAAAR
jgi:aspartate-semialdehyde dehydrogenase